MVGLIFRIFGFIFGTCFRFKYILLPDTSGYYQIVALRSIEHIVSVGEVGGYVSGRGILSHRGSCWILSGSKVSGKNVRVSGNSFIRGLSTIRGENITITNSTINSCNLWGENFTIEDSNMTDCTTSGGVVSNITISDSLVKTVSFGSKVTLREKSLLRMYSDLSGRLKIENTTLETTTMDIGDSNRLRTSTFSIKDSFFGESLISFFNVLAVSITNSTILNKCLNNDGNVVDINRQCITGNHKLENEQDDEQRPNRNELPW